MKLKGSLAFVLSFVLVLTGCTSVVTSPSVPQPRRLTVFAAASLTDAFSEIGRNFEAAHAGVTLAFNFAGSQALRTQIEEGAPADVFASAHMAEMETLVAGGQVVSGTPRTFLTNKLVIIVPAENPAGLERIEDLASPGVKLVLAAEEVPVGRYSRQALDQINDFFGRDFKDQALANVVSNEDNVRQVVAKVQLGEADAGIVYTSDAVAATELKTIEVPAELNVVAEYPIAALTSSAHAELSEAFIAYVLSPEGQAILQTWGFSPPE